MGFSWDSAVFSGHGHDFDRLASQLADIGRCCGDPQVMLHFMLATPGGRPFVSAEITAFRKRRVRWVSGHNLSLDERVFGESGFAFRDPAVELARRVSAELSAESIYLAFNDSLGAAGYVAFTKGEAASFEILGWEGTDRYFRDSSHDDSDSQPAAEDVICRASRSFRWDLGFGGITDVVTAFYEKATETLSYLLVDGRRPLDRPRRV